MRDPGLLISGVIAMLVMVAVPMRRRIRAHMPESVEVDAAPAGFLVRLLALQFDGVWLNIILLLFIVTAAALGAGPVAGGVLWPITLTVIGVFSLCYFTWPTARSGQTWASAGTTASVSPPHAGGCALSGRSRPLDDSGPVALVRHRPVRRLHYPSVCAANVIYSERGHAADTADQ